MLTPSTGESGGKWSPNLRSSFCLERRHPLLSAAARLQNRPQPVRFSRGRREPQIHCVFQWLVTWRLPCVTGLPLSLFRDALRLERPSAARTARMEENDPDRDGAQAAPPRGVPRWQPISEGHTQPGRIPTTLGSARHLCRPSPALVPVCAPRSSLPLACRRTPLSGKRGNSIDRARVLERLATESSVGILSHQDLLDWNL